MLGKRKERISLNLVENWSRQRGAVYTSKNPMSVTRHNVYYLLAGVISMIRLPYSYPAPS